MWRKCSRAVTGLAWSKNAHSHCIRLTSKIVLNVKKLRVISWAHYCPSLQRGFVQLPRSPPAHVPESRMAQALTVLHMFDNSHNTMDWIPAEYSQYSLTVQEKSVRCFCRDRVSYDASRIPLQPTRLTMLGCTQITFQVFLQLYLLRPIHLTLQVLYLS